jgi:hypothetical protein
MKTTRYLYDCEPQDFWDLPYGEALAYKHNKAKELLSTLEDLLCEQLERTSYDDTYKLRERIFYVTKAMMHTKRLLDEL